MIICREVVFKTRHGMVQRKRKLILSLLLIKLELKNNKKINHLLLIKLFEYFI